MEYLKNKNQIEVVKEKQSGKKERRSRREKGRKSEKTADGSSGSEMEVRAKSRSPVAVVRLNRLSTDEVEKRLRSEESSLERQLCLSDSSSADNVSVSGYRSAVSRDSAKAQKRPHSDGSSGEEWGGKSPATPNNKVRGRGRPPSTGEYVGLAQAKQKLLEAEKQQMRLEAEKDIVAAANVARELRLKFPTRSEYKKSDSEGEAVVHVPVEKQTTPALIERITGDLTSINYVAENSKNLNGRFIRYLKDAALSVANVVEELSQRTTSEETALLQAENASMKKEMAELRKEIASIREEMARVQNSHPLPGQSAGVEVQPVAVTETNIVEELKRSLMIEIGTMMNARLQVLEERLPPAPIVRPPLAARAKSLSPPQLEVSESVPLAGPATRPNGPEGKRKAKRGKKAKSAKDGPAQPVTAVPGPSAKPTTGSSGAWVTVGKNGKQTPTKKKERSQTSDKAKKPRLRVHKTAAIVVTLQPEAEKKGETYAAVLSDAKSRIDWRAMGIEGLRIDKTATGARIIKVPGAAKNEMADALAEKIRETLTAERVRVHRPVATAELRVSGLDDSVSAEELAAAIAQGGGCSTEQVKAGDIRRDSGGMGSAWVRCPVTAAKKVADQGRLLVGWVSASVRLLQPRAQRCFRCLEVGHVRVTCTSEVDRSDLCYQCAQPGHRASQCSSALHCALCAAAKLPANHKVGTKACKDPKLSKSKTTASATPRPAVACPAVSEAPVASSEAMDEVDIDIECP